MYLYTVLLDTHSLLLVSRLTVPPNTLAALSISVTVWLSVRYERRAVFIIIAAAIAIIGELHVGSKVSMIELLKGYIVLLTATKRKWPIYSTWNRATADSSMCSWSSIRWSPSRSHRGLYRQRACSQVRLPFNWPMFLPYLYVTSWPGENVAGQTKRAVAVAMQITFGDIGAIVG